MDFPAGFLTPDEIEALLLSLRISAVAVAAALPFAFAMALLLARRDFPGKLLVDGLVVGSQPLQTFTASFDDPRIDALIEAALDNAERPISPAAAPALIIKSVSAKQRPRRPTA